VHHALATLLALEDTRPLVDVVRLRLNHSGGLAVLSVVVIALGLIEGRCRTDAMLQQRVEEAMQSLSRCLPPVSSTGPRPAIPSRVYYARRPTPRRMWVSAV
jgi:hypothetical protein